MGPKTAPTVLPKVKVEETKTELGTGGGGAKKVLFWLLFSLKVVSNSSETLWTVARQAPLSMGLPRQEYWSRLPFPSPGDLPDPGIKPMSLISSALAGGFFTTSITWEALSCATGHQNPLWRNVYVGSSAHFLFLFFCFSLSCMSCLYVFEINPLSVASVTNIFFHSEGCLLVLFIGSFAVQKLLS